VKVVQSIRDGYKKLPTLAISHAINAEKTSINDRGVTPTEEPSTTRDYADGGAINDRRYYADGGAID